MWISKENLHGFYPQTFFKYTSIIKPVRIYHRSIFMKFQAPKPIDMNIILCEFDKKNSHGFDPQTFFKYLSIIKPLRVFHGMNIFSKECTKRIVLVNTVTAIYSLHRFQTLFILSKKISKFNFFKKWLSPKMGEKNGNQVYVTKMILGVQNV